MGKADVNVNIWLNEKKRFADLFNGVLIKESKWYGRKSWKR